jgi:membrane protein
MYKELPPAAKAKVKIRRMRIKLKKKAETLDAIGYRVWYYFLHKLMIVWELLNATVGEFNRDKAYMYGAALSYYAVFTMAPMILVIVISVGFFIGEEQTLKEIMENIATYIGESTAQQIQYVLKGIRENTKGATGRIVSFATLIFSSTVIFYNLKESMNTFWKVEAQNDASFWSMILARIHAFLMVLGAGALLIFGVVLEAVMVQVNRFFKEILPDSLANLILYSHHFVSFTLFAIMISMIFRYLPDARMRWREIFIGASFTSVLLILGQIGISWYIGMSNLGNTYGAAGSVIVLLAWVFYSSQILYFGAEFSYVISETFGNGLKRKAENLKSRK